MPLRSRNVSKVRAAAVGNPRATDSVLEELQCRRNQVSKPEDMDAIFDALPAASTDKMIGGWKGYVLPCGYWCGADASAHTWLWARSPI